MLKKLIFSLSRGKAVTIKYIYVYTLGNSDTYLSNYQNGQGQKGSYSYYNCEPTFEERLSHLQV